MRSDKQKLLIDVVCTGNICRSPMGEIMLKGAVEDAGLDDRVEVVSRGITGWHEGDRADRRAIEQLRRDGYDGSGHIAHELVEQDHDADLFLAMADNHVDGMRSMGIPSDKIRLFRSFDPDATGSQVDDPYYGNQSDFERTSQEISAALPGIIDYIAQSLGDS